MNTKHPLRASRVAAVLSLALLLGGVTRQAFSAPAPAAPAPTQSPFGRLVPVAPTAPTGTAGVAGAAAPVGPVAAPTAAPAPNAAAAAAAASGVTSPRIVVIDRQL